MEQAKKLIIFMPSIEDGGVEKNLFILLNYLKHDIKKISLITYKNPKTKINKKIKIITPSFNKINFNGRYIKYFFCLLVLFRILLFSRKNLVLSFQANIFSIALCNFLDVKIISRSNSSSSGWSQNIIKQTIFKFYFPKANKIIVNSYEFKKEMDKRYQINTQCILNPFEFEKIKYLSNKKCKKIYQNKNLKLISIGRLTDQKDFMTLLKAIKICKRQDIELIIIGKGKEEYNLKKYVSSNRLTKKIKFLGYKKNPFKYLRQADIFILTSTFEGSPNVLVEALFLKKFVISTNCPTGPNEILKNGKLGALFKVGDYKSISKFINNFKFNKKTNKKIIKGYKSTKRFNYFENCGKYSSLIQSYLN